MGLDPFPSLSLSHFFVSNFFQSILPCRRSYLCHLSTTWHPVFQLNEEPLTGQSGPVNLASKMAPKEKTLVKEKARKRKSPKGKEKATVIREEPEVNLFLECLQSINKPPMANIQPEERRSSRHSQSKKPSPSTQTERSPRRNDSALLSHNQQPGAAFIDAQFKEWQDERAVGHTTHDQYHVWLEERIDDNRRLANEFAARERIEEQNKAKRLLANSFPEWGQGLKTKVTMKNNEEITTHLPHEEGTPQSAPAPAAEQQSAAIMMTSTE